MNKEEVLTKINEYISVKDEQIIEQVICTENFTFTNLRDSLIGLGKIVEENFESNYYIVSIPAGIAERNTAILLILWQKRKVSIFAYAKEGLINQHTADIAIDKVIESITQRDGESIFKE
ncbi:hypothetical protein [Ligilactobacillus salivarius]|uniref:hypothetical protein n=1 Tax=Ligilactobacillus salivarius TaxID=1624 RepID=UPI0030F8CD98